MKILHYEAFDRREEVCGRMNLTVGAQPIYSRWKNELIVSTVYGILRFSPESIPAKKRLQSRCS